MFLGFFGLIYGLLTSPKTVEEALLWSLISVIAKVTMMDIPFTTTKNDEATSANGDVHLEDHHGEHFASPTTK